MPGVEHRFCVRYLHANFKGQGYKSKAFKDALWAAAQATDAPQFQHHMGVIKSMNSKAFDYLDKIDPRMWSRHAFSTNSKSNMLLNNLPMPFNAWVKEAREKPILTMMETIRRHLMTRFQAKRDGARMANFVICPKIVKKLERSKADARNHIAPCRNKLEFEIDHSHDRIILFNFGTCYCGRWHPRRIVNLSTRTCSCGSWQLNGIPCAHACCAIYANKELPEDYVHEWYQMETYIKAYSPEIHAMPGPQECPNLRNNTILSPLLTNQHDRPRKLRRRAPEENEPNPNKDSVDRKATMLDDAHNQKIQIRSGQSQSDVG
ncbi:uncharacterized protein LOC132168118 isoform X1 [Corylus avellana]|uniref:uncharacterized protein LOC132168118 isoform X1 n=1 Tax=Corylus avellana TaxID=13451 RepID=UPI00286C9912|nr:uncharacterized protein LOC132168118 isoform X1 [Corylus avellana]XP_059435187.1 uncharacterized protein LOC132168118 isoform X1 [Corylus avellana]XP_059435188.1 uncharacterized protein LOC132168118 isoform X1 [Corylus avellana]